MKTEQKPDQIKADSSTLGSVAWHYQCFDDFRTLRLNPSPQWKTLKALVAL
jgi:hypothetical protein